MAEKQLGQAEIWDDSDLLDSWNEAFEEYKKYHSLAAKGEKVKLNVVEAKEKPVDSTSSDVTHPTVDHGDLTASAPDNIQAAQGAQKAAITASTGPQITPSVPQTLLGNVQSEDMRNLMISWYYAGYYTGLYEGKQQGHANAMHQGNG